jgi:AcrR family transcriptional regulator
MTYGDRRACILKAVRNLFAEKGFEGATTRELAKAAEVSEALLYKHFRSKEVLYAAMLETCNDFFIQEFQKMARLEASTATLILIVHFLVTTRIAFATSENNKLVRLYLRSIAEDGEFARIASRRAPKVLASKLEECLKRSIASGDLEDSLVTPKLRVWLAQRVVFGVMVDLLPTGPYASGAIPRQKLIEQSVSFILRGLGLRESVIRRLYRPEALTAV